MSEVPSLSSEVEELQEIDALIRETFKHCDNMKTDILEYSPDTKRDLMNFKNHMVNLSEIQKNLSGLACAVTKVDSHDFEAMGSEPIEISHKFDRIHESAMEDQYIDDAVEQVISSVDVYISTQHEGMDEVGEDLLVTLTTDSYKDPITKQPIKDPVKSKICKHLYDRSSILIYLRKKSRCPYSGCTTVLRREDLVDDLKTKQLMNT